MAEQFIYFKFKKNARNFSNLLRHEVAQIRS